MATDAGNKPITIEDVGAACGLSHATVSRVINGEPNVRPATAAKVRDAIAALGYTPNVHAQALQGGRTKTMGVLLPDRWVNYPALLEGMTAAGARLGYDILLCAGDYLAKAERLAVEGRVDGFVIRNMSDPEAHEKLFRFLRKKGLPFVLLGDQSPGCRSVAIDNVGGARAMAHHFIGHGFERLVFIGVPEKYNDSLDRFYGFKMGLLEKGFDQDRLFLVNGDYSPASGYRAMAECYDRLRPDAVFAANDRMALGALMFFRERGLRVPQDVGLAGFDDAFFAKYLSPSLTTVRPPFSEMGAAGIETLAGHLEGRSSMGELILKTELVVRASCGCEASCDIL